MSLFKHLNPLRIVQRRQRLEREAREEAQVARRRHGDDAAWALRLKLTDPNLTRWGRTVLTRALRRL